MEVFNLLIAFTLGSLVGYILDKFVCKIYSKYFLLEVLSAILTVAIFYKLGTTIEFFIVVTIFYLLLILSFIDFKYHAVPDYLLLAVLVLVFFIPSRNLLEQFQSAFLISGAVVLLSFILNFYIQNIKSKLTKNEELKTQTSLGEGDIPIVAVMAATLGVQESLLAIFLASFFAIIPALYSKIVKKEQETPFIPYLSLGLFVEYIFSLSKVFS